MITVRHIEKLWNARKYAQLLQELLGPRIEALAAGQLLEELGGDKSGGEPGGERAMAAAAAMALIRLDELNQPHVPLAPRLIRAIASAQEADGGWGQVMTTALCLRALSLQNGQGLAIDRGMQYLASLQCTGRDPLGQPCGIWPRIPMRRMPEDALASALVMLELSDNPAFVQAVGFDDAVEWFESNSPFIEPAAATLWSHAKVKSRAVYLAA